MDQGRGLFQTLSELTRGATGERVDPLSAEQIAAAIRVRALFAREKVWASLTKFYLSVN